MNWAAAYTPSVAYDLNLHMGQNEGVVGTALSVGRQSSVFMVQEASTQLVSVSMQKHP
jgi:hypothetical protein